MALLTVIPLGSLPAAGLPPSAIDALAGPGGPARMTKRSSYNSVEWALAPAGTGSGDYALYTYWQDSRSWRPEGPRGATPATYDTSTVAGRVPVRVSTPAVECEVCLVLCAGTGVVDGMGAHVPAEIRETTR